MAKPAITCACGCGEMLPTDRHHRQKFLNPTHRRRVQARRVAHKKRIERAQQTGDFSILEGKKTGFEDESRYIDESDLGRKLRRGPLYEQFVAEGLAAKVWHGEVSQAEAARRFETSKMNVSRWMAAYSVDMAREAAQREFDAQMEVFHDLTKFTERFFPDMLVPSFHVDWASAIDSTLGSGGRLLLLAPQRHGKSEMLIRYCIMRICQDPNIRILWVGKTKDMAEKAVGYIRQILEHNHELREAAIGPGMEWKPSKRTGVSWTDAEFTVANRTKVLKSPTMVALGTGGSILGRDADLIILDDPQDRARCQSPTERQNDREWFLTDFLSRKEESTGVAFIMSRQHLEDLPGHVMKEQADDWDILIYRAHDPACTLPEEDYEAHTDCVLWPEKRSWRWLHGQKKANIDHFSRNYMNDPKTDATTYITADELDKIKDHTRPVGTMPLGGGRLIAGVDPAEAKPVAAVLWCFDGVQRHVIDAREFSASVVGLRELLTEWPATYGVREVAFEKNMAKSWLLDETVRDLIRNNGVKIHQHYTDRINKNSNAIGPVAMFQRMRTSPPEVTLPWGFGPGIDRINRLIQSWLNFDPDWAGHKHADDDLTMAAWFPQLIMDTWAQPQVPDMVLEYDPIGSSYL